MQQMLSGVLDDIRAGGWPLEDRDAIKRLDEKLRAYIDTRNQKQAGADVTQTVLKLNESLSSLQNEINELYAAEEIRAKTSVDLVVTILGGVTLFALVLGGADFLDYRPPDRDPVAAGFAGFGTYCQRGSDRGTAKRPRRRIGSPSAFDQQHDSTLARRYLADWRQLASACRIRQPVGDYHDTASGRYRQPEE